MNEKIILRKSLQQFAESMEKTLKQNDYKGGWSEDKCSLVYLFDKFEYEYKEFHETFEIYRSDNQNFNERIITRKYNNTAKDCCNEILDMANVLMKIYDRLQQNRDD